jgi:hypothetical protein
MTINPPPTWTAGSEIPKKERMWVPMKYDPIRKKKLFVAIRPDNALRVAVEYSWVIARNIGLPPNGSTMGNSPLSTRNKLFAASTKTFLAIQQSAPCPGEDRLTAYRYRSKMSFSFFISISSSFMP